jgi:hypothetical protein
LEHHTRLERVISGLQDQRIAIYACGALITVPRCEQGEIRVLAEHHLETWSGSHVKAYYRELQAVNPHKLGASYRNLTDDLIRTKDTL